MPPAARTELDPGAPCRTCGKALPAGKSLCPACGAAHGEANRCPHCQAIADVEPHSALGFRCLVCGGPRIALDVAGVTPGERTRTALAAAANEQTKHVMFSAAGLLLTGMGLLALLVASVAVLSAAPGLVPTIAAYFGAAVPLAVGLFCLSQAAGARTLRGAALRRAQVSTLADAQTVTGALDARRAAELMRLGPEQAELLLAEASVAALLEEAPAPRLRVEPPAATALADGLGEQETEQGAPRAKTAAGDTEL